MQAAADAMPMPVSDPSLANRWLKANLLAAITIPLTAGVLPIVADRTFPGLSDATFSWVSAAVSAIAVVVCLTVYATLTGAVLREKLPAFSRRTWIGGHLAFSAVWGLIMARAELEMAPGSAWAWYMSGRQFEASNHLFAVLVSVPVLGALLGCFQALLLWNVARGALAWIAAFAVGCVAIVAMSRMVWNFEPISSLISNDATFVLEQSVAFAWIMVMAAIMLPAFNRLTPKN